jgi:hypothetical protein
VIGFLLSTIISSPSVHIFLFIVTKIRSFRLNGKLE